MLFNIIIITIVVLFIVFNLISNYIKKKSYEDIIASLTSQNTALQVENYDLRQYLSAATSNLRQHIIFKNIYSDTPNEEVIEAVKYAMKAAHPDSPNGNTSDFIKYRELYNKISGKKH
jgi:competence protein ComGC